MSLMCLLGRHKPSLASISHRSGGGHKCLCEACALPLERDHRGKWREAKPLYLQAAQSRTAERPRRWSDRL